MGGARFAERNEQGLAAGMGQGRVEFQRWARFLRPVVVLCATWSACWPLANRPLRRNLFQRCSGLQ